MLPLLRLGLCGVMLASATSCASGDEVLVEFHDDEVRVVLDATGIFATSAERDEAVETFRSICVGTSANSVNEFSVYDMLTNPSDYPANFVETAEVGCPEKFATAREKIEAGDCFGGVVSDCDD